MNYRFFKFPLKNILCILPFLTFSLAILGIVYGSNGARGTDQYWYLADVETISRNEAPLTNIIYPAKLLREVVTGEQPNYFMHNGPILAIAGFLTQFFGAYHSWILINLISHAICALVIFSASRIHTSPEIATWVTCLYILSPIAIWQTLNILQEQAYSGIFALILISLVYRNHAFFHSLLLVSFCLGALSHPIFTALALSYCIYLMVGSLVHRNFLKIVLSIILFFGFIFINNISDNLYPSSFQPDLKSIISGAVPGVSNMMWHYSDVAYPIDASLIIEKLKSALKAHFSVSATAPLYIYTNLAILAYFYISIFRYHSHREIVLSTGLAFGLYAAILVLMQTQARYQQIIAPATFLLIALAIFELRDRVNIKLGRLAGIAVFSFSVALLYLMTQKTHHESSVAATAVELTREELAALPKTSKLLMLDSAHELKISYSVRPRMILTAKTELISKESLLKAISLFQPDYLISTNPSPPGYLSIANKVKTIHSTLADIHLFRLNPTIIATE